VSMLGCLLPYTPLLFMGQEWAASTPFPYFSHLPGDVGAAMASNRIREFEHYGAAYSREVLSRMPDPQAETTFQNAKLNWSEREKPMHAAVLALYRECLRLRAKHAIFQSAPRDQWKVEKVGDESLAITWREPAAEWQLLLTLTAGISLRPHDGRAWQPVLSTNETRFGGVAGNEYTGPGAVLWRSK
jgi:maltooligosyltrehalose trehalohydrolase